MVLWSGVEEENESWKHKSYQIIRHLTISYRFMPVPCRFMRFVIHLQGCSTAKTEAGPGHDYQSSGEAGSSPHPSWKNQQTNSFGFRGCWNAAEDARWWTADWDIDGYFGWMAWFRGEQPVSFFLLKPTWFLVCGCRVKVASCYIPMFWLFGSATLCCWLPYQVGICSVGHAHIWLVITYTFHYFPAQQLGWWVQERKTTECE